jgi:benzoyl-CoA reductase subunit D
LEVYNLEFPTLQVKIAGVAPNLRELKNVKRMITAGIDCGAKNTKTVIIKDGKIMAKSTVLTGFNQEEAIEKSLAQALEAARISKDDLEKIGATGSGKKAIHAADVMVNDIKAMAKAALYYFPNSRTVCDVGAEEGKTAIFDKKGNPLDFAINEKCAAGGGSFIEAMCRALETPLEEMGPLALTSKADISINAQCVIFLESEVVGLIHAKTSKADISKAIQDAMASRIVPIIRRVGVNPDMVMMGGVAYNPGFVAALGRELNLDKIYIPDSPEFGAAVGAAIAASEK